MDDSKALSDQSFDTSSDCSADYYQMNIYDYPEYIPESWLVYKTMNKQDLDSSDGS